MIEVELPDGSVAEFPDGTPNDAIKGALQKRFGGQRPAPAPVQATAPQRQAGQQTYSGALNTWLENAISGIPVVGPAIQKGSDYLGTEAIGLATGQDPAEMRRQVEERRAGRAEQYPASAISGQLGGAIGSTGALGATAGGARALGVTGESLLGRILASGGSNAAISGADTVARGGDGADVVNNMAVSGGLGLAIPAAGEGINRIVSAVGNRVAPTIDAMIAPEQEASRRLGAAVARDRAASPEGVPGQFDEAVARVTGVPMINADRGGETTRALARSVANQSPEARNTIEKVASDRFGSQGLRASEFIRRLSGGAVDDIGYQQAIRDTARYVNKPAYRRAYAEGSNLVKTPELERLMGSPAVVSAMKRAITRGKDRAIKEGFGAFNPAISVTDDGRILFNRTKSGGGTTFPDLQFWDYTKQELDDMANAAARSGENGSAATLRGLAADLRGELDNIVPSYRKAREGAASYFGAEDAIEAGKKFANSPRLIPEARQAIEKMAPAEKAGFQTGFASELIDKIGAVRDRTNVINQIFGSQAARSQIELVFGPQKAKALEAYVRVENLADKLRGAMGNSTTARQLVELGIGGGTGFALSGDWKGALTGAVVAKGGRLAADRANNQVMQIVAKMLTSDDPKIIESAVKQAAKSPAFMRALEDLGNAIAAPARGAAIGATEQRQPLELTVGRPQ